MGSGTTPCNQTHHIPTAKRVNKDYKHLHVPSVRLWGQMSSHQTKQKTRVSRTFWRDCTEILDTSVWRCESLLWACVFSFVSVSYTLHAQCVCVCVHARTLSHFSHIRLFVTPWTVGQPAPLSMGFSRQEYWSRLPCPPPGDLPNLGIEPMSLMSPALAGRFFTASAIWEAHGLLCVCVC